MTYDVRPLAPDDGEALAALMERSEGAACYCRYWHFTGTNKEWEARVGLAPEKNRAELLDGVAHERDDARGIVAVDREAGGSMRTLVGWMKLAPRQAMQKLLVRAPYRALGDDAVGLSIGCFVVDPAHRRRGLARALVEGALEHARKLGAPFVEAYPRVSEHPLHDGEAYLGPIALYRSLGFELAREAPQYPVLRKYVNQS